MSSNIICNKRIEEGERKMYGMPYGYAIEYCIGKEMGQEYIYFPKKPLVLPEDPENTDNRPSPIDLAAQCIFELVQEKKAGVWVHIYNRRVKIEQRHRLYDIKKLIRDFQLDMVRVSSEAPKYVKDYLKSKIFSVVKDMPVY